MTDQATAASPAPGPGHNLPATDLGLFLERIETQAQDIRARLGDLSVGLARIPEGDVTDDTESTITDFAKQVSIALKDAEALRKELKAPITAQGKALDDLFKTWTEPAKTMLEGLKQRLARYRSEKEARIRAEQAEREKAQREEEQRQAEEAARLEAQAREQAQAAESEGERQAAAATFQQAEQARQAAAHAGSAADDAAKDRAAPVHAKGDYGSVGHARKQTTFEITDEGLIPAVALWPFIDLPCKEKAVRAAIKAGVTEIPGVRIYQKESIVVR